MKSYAGDGAAAGDLRLLPPAVGAWAGAWVGIGGVRAVTEIACLAGVVALMALMLPRWRGVVVPGVLGVAAGALCGGLHAEAVRAGPLPGLARTGGMVRVVAAAGSDPVLLPGHQSGARWLPALVVLRVTVLRVHAGAAEVATRSPVLVLAQGDVAAWLSVLPTQRLELRGRLETPRSGDVDLAAVLSARGPPALVGRPQWQQRVAGTVRADLRAAVAHQSADVRGLLPGLVLGDVSELPPELATDFRVAGLTHLVAVSGANVAIVLAAVLAVARGVRLPPRAAVTLSAVMLGAFVVLVRPTPSVLRAAVMGGLLLLAAATGRVRRGLPALLFATLVLVLVDPVLSRSEGFTLSVAATAALLGAGPAWARAFGRRLPERIAAPLAVAVAAQLACGPFIAALSGQLSLVSVPANLLAEPAVPPATLLGVLAAVVGPVCAPAARVLTWFAAWPTAWLAEVARVSAAVPGGSVAWPTGLWGGLGLAAVTGGGLLALRTRPRRRLLAAASRAHGRR